MTIRDIAISFGYEVDAKSERKVNDSINKLKSTATKVLGAIGIGFSLVNANKIIEEFGKINAQIKNATKGLGDQKEIQNEIIAAANAARVAYADIAGLTAKLVQQNADLFDVTNAAKYAELTTKLFKSENKSQSEILALQDAINKSFAKGAVEAETVNQIIEKSPAAADLLAKAVGASRTELAKMASEGKISLEQLRDAFLNNTDNIEAAFGNVNLTISDALLNIRNGWGLWLTQMDDTLGVTRTIAKFMTRAFNQIMNALRKVQAWTERVVKAFGGAEKMMKMIAIAGGAIFAALNAGKILSFLKSMAALINVASLKFLAIAAVITIVALLIEDFIHFMQGNNSMLGEMLKMAGIDADAVRKTIIDAWNTIKSFLVKTWEYLKRIGKAVWGGLTKFWIEHGERIKKLLVAAWNAIKSALSALWNGLKEVATSVFNSLKAFWDKWGGDITTTLEAVFGFLSRSFGNLVDGITAVFNIFAALFRGDWDAFWDGIKDYFKIIWKQIKNIFNAIGDIIILGLALILGKSIDDIKAWVSSVKAWFNDVWKNIKKIFQGLITFITGVFSRDWRKAWEGIKQVFKGVMEFISSLFNSAIDGLKKLFPSLSPVLDGVKRHFEIVWNAIAGAFRTAVNIIKAVFKIFSSAFKGDWEGVWNGIKEFFSGVWEGFKETVQMVFDVFKNILSIFGIDFKAVMNTVSSFFKNVWNGVKNFFKSIWASISKFFKGIWDDIKSVFNTAVEWFSGVFTSAWNAIKTAFSSAASFFSSVWRNIKSVFKAVKEWFSNIFGGAWSAVQDAFSSAATFFSGIWDGIKNVFNTVKKWFANIFTNAWNAIKSVFLTVSSFFSGKWTDIQNVFNGVKEWFSNIFSSAWSGITSAFTNVSTFFSGIWESIKSSFGSVTEWFSNIFADAWQAVKDVFSTGGQVFDGVTDGIVSAFKAVVNAIINGINKVVAIPFNAINDMLSNLRDINIFGMTPFDFIQRFEVPQIPTLATGGVLKKGQTGYLEGDGAEAVVPLEKNIGWIKKVAEQFTKAISPGSFIGDAFKSIGSVISSVTKTLLDKFAQGKANADNSGLTDAIRSFSADIATLAKGATASPGTVQSMVTSTTNRSLTQNNYFDSTFHGDREVQRRSSEVMSKNANDATAQLARALAYTR